MSKTKYSVNLPQTKFPMKADLPLREPELQSLWERHHVYQKMQDKNAKGPLFLLHDGPPYANGHIHMGHALNKVLKDIIVKYKSLRGFRSPYVPGWDCHGLPIEHQLMKEKGWDKRKVGRVAFRKEAARYAEHFIDVQRQEFKRLGVLAEWDKPYKTLAPEYEASIARTFYDLLEKGFIYRDKKPVYWCASCETALAEAEVEYEEKSSSSIYVKFALQQWPSNPECQKAEKTAGKRVSVLVWTTTPWTLPANVALAFHPEQTYRIWESPKHPEKYLVGTPGWAFLEAMFGEGTKTPIEIPGLALEGLVAKNPLNNNDSQGVLAEFVSQEDGTGVVHIAPGHGQEDYGVGREYGLPTLSPVDDSGRFTTDVLPNSLAGELVWEANAEILQLLEKARHLLKTEKITHSYPHCWRCKNPILFRATEQWFLKVSDEFRKRLIASTDRVEWIPAYGKDRILGMLQTRPDWCLARQRYWGTPIPMFYCEKCKEPLKDKAVFDRVVEAFRKDGGSAWYEGTSSPSHSNDAASAFTQGAKCAKCGHTAFKPEQDILDVWFDSGVSWAAVVRDRLGVQGREGVMYLEGSDQHRGWFQTSLIPAMAVTGEPPYAQVLTHGFVLDGEGRAMSKSVGNVIAPQEIVGKYGADIVRLWVAVTDYREDVRLSQPILDRVIDTYRKIRNTLRFLLGNLADFDPVKDSVAPKDLEPIDLEMLGSLDALIADVRAHYDAHEFHLVASQVCNDFCINALSEYYLDVQKDVLYCDAKDSRRRRSAQTAFLHLAKDVARILAPLLSFTAEETWRTLAEQKLLDPKTDEAESVFLNAFPSERKYATGHKSSVRLAFLADLKREANRAIEPKRQAGIIKGAGDAHLFLSSARDSLRLEKAQERQLAASLGVSKVTLVEGPPAETWVQKIEPAPGKKCERCWVWREDVGAEGLCGRCAEAEAAAAAAQAAVQAASQ
jgi:isoleucyl-tRNA synthetase